MSYLQGTLDYRLKYDAQAGASISFQGYADVNWTRDLGR